MNTIPALMTIAAKTLGDLAKTIEPEDEKDAERLKRIAAGIPDLIEKTFILDYQELAFVAHLLGARICLTCAEALRDAEKEETT